MMVSIITTTTKVNLQKAGCVSVTKLIILIPKLENVTVAGSKYNGKYYYFDAETGLMLKGWNKIGNYTYFLKQTVLHRESGKDQRQILLLR